MKELAPGSRLSGLLLAGVVLFVVVGTVGCGGEPEKATVSGKVTGIHPRSKLKQTVVAGSVTFYHEQSKKSFSASINPDGSYEADVYVGKSKVTVQSVEPDWDDKENKPKADRRKWFPLPTSYAMINSSPLELDVQAGGQKYDVHVKIPVVLDDE